jgi:hypothetical protein
MRSPPTERKEGSFSSLPLDIYQQGEEPQHMREISDPDVYGGRLVIKEIVRLCECLPPYGVESIIDCSKAVFDDIERGIIRSTSQNGHEGRHTGGVTI